MTTWELTPEAVKELILKRQRHVSRGGSRPRSRLAVVTMALVASCALAAPAQASNALSFTTTRIASDQAVGEPRVVIDASAPGPRFFVVAPGVDASGKLNTFLWWSTDGRRFAGPALTNQGSEDSDLAIDANHTVYTADATDPSGRPTIPISVWHPQTHRFSRVGFAAQGQTALDRPWIAAPGPRRLVAIARGSSDNELAWVSVDGGARFTTDPEVIDTNVVRAGPLVAGPSPRRGGTAPLYFLYVRRSGGQPGLFASGDLRLATSTDGGADWTTSLVATNQYSTLFPVVASDNAGNLYAVWSGYDQSSNNSQVVVFSASRDKGRSWRTPRAVSDNRVDGAGYAPPALFPWIVAGASGRVDIAYVIGNQPIVNAPGADFGGPATRWDVRVAQSLNATSAEPTWTSRVASADFHTGSICTMGASCPTPYSSLGVGNAPTPMDRRDLDFAGAAIDGSGRVYVPFCSDRPASSGNLNDVVFANIDVNLARQTLGPTLAVRHRRR